MPGAGGSTWRMGAWCVLGMLKHVAIGIAIATASLSIHAPLETLWNTLHDTKSSLGIWGFSIKEQPLIPPPPSKPLPLLTQLGFPLNANTMCRKVFTFFSHKFQNISKEKKKKRKKKAKDLLAFLNI